MPDHSKRLAEMVTKCGGEGRESCTRCHGKGCSRCPPHKIHPKPDAENLAWLERWVLDVAQNARIVITRTSSIDVVKILSWNGRTGDKRIGYSEHTDLQTARIEAALEAAEKCELWKEKA